MFSETAALPQGLSIDAFATPISHEIDNQLIFRYFITHFPWKTLRSTEFELRFGQFLLLDFNQKKQLFGDQQQQRRRFGQPPPPPAQAPPGLSENNQGTDRWMKKLGFMPNPKVLAPKTFQAKMCLPSPLLFEKAKYIIEQLANSPPESKKDFISLTKKSSSNTCDFKMNQVFGEIRVTIDLETKQPVTAVDKSKLGHVDFGLALSPVDLRVAFALEKELADENNTTSASEEHISEKERKQKAVDTVLEAHFGKEKTADAVTAGTEESSTSTTNTIQSKREKLRTSYVFTVKPTPIPKTLGNDDSADEQQQQEKQPDEKQIIQHSFPIGGIRLDLTKATLNDKNETLEAEMEWDIDEAIRVLNEEIEKNENGGASTCPESVIALMKEVRDAVTTNEDLTVVLSKDRKKDYEFFSQLRSQRVSNRGKEENNKDKKDGENADDQENNNKKRLDDAVFEKLKRTIQLRSLFIKHGMSVLAKAGISLAMSLKNEKVVVPTEFLAAERQAPAVRQREE